jgi:hypothetical protein
MGHVANASPPTPAKPSKPVAEPPTEATPAKLSILITNTA